jgi:Site-specific recombinase XerD
VAADKNGKELPKGVTLRKDGRYMGRVEYQGEKHTLYDRDLKVLKKRIANLKYEVEHGLYAKEENITVASWFDTWITEYKMNSVKIGTVESYKDCFKLYIKPVHGRMKLKDMRGEHIQKLYNDMFRKKYSRATIELVSVILSSMYKQAIKNEIVQKNPVAMTILPRKREKQEQRVFTVAEQKLFINYAKESQHFNLYKIALSTGMRSGELRALEWNDIDFKNEVIKVRGTLKSETGAGSFKDLPKTTSSYRDIPMIKEVWLLLKQIKSEQLKAKLRLGNKWIPQEGLEKLVFPNSFGQPLHSSSINLDMKRIIQQINESKGEFVQASLHTLRHTFATRGIEKGIPPKVMQEILGHSSLSMTMDLYAHVLPDTKANEIKKIASLF